MSHQDTCLITATGHSRDVELLPLHDDYRFSPGGQRTAYTTEEIKAYSQLFRGFNLDELPIRNKTFSIWHFDGGKGLRI